ncbi:hypothetical protein [Actinomadura harenae]|uniref:hypothetical protein n=1 Tax=Actinomadura harenae TaxID=2483351 RepID=UPI0011C3F890|nr:hypothetical protein [Actinomadura harenae]
MAEAEDPSSQALPLAEVVRLAAWGLREAVGAGLRVESAGPVESAGRVLDLVFWAWDEFLGVLHEVESEMKTLHDRTVAESMASRSAGAVWDDKDAAKVRERLRVLDEVLVNLSSCRNTLGGSHMLLSHTTSALDLLNTLTPPQTVNDPAGDPAGTGINADTEAKTDE